jgi:MYXO-CTERM domain-containing protein
VVEYSYEDWMPSSLDQWVDGDEEYGINIGKDVDAEWLSDFHQRLGYDQARLTRLRTRLSGSALVDMNLDAAADIDVDRDIYVTYDPSQGCGVTPSPASGLAWIGLLALLRRRRS